MRNLFVVWVLTALWHGISVNFVLWGMLLCFVIMVEKVIVYACHKNRENISVEDVSRKANEEKTLDELGERNEDKYIEVKKLNLKLTLKSTMQHFYVLFIIVLSWTCFAITDLQDLSVYLGRMFGLLEGIRVNDNVCITMLQKYGVTILIGLFLCTKTAHRCYRKLKNSRIGMIALVILFWLAVWYIHIMGNNPFLYFRF